MLIYAGLLIAMAGHGKNAPDSDLTPVSPVATPSEQPYFQANSFVRRSDI